MGLQKFASIILQDLSFEHWSGSLVTYKNNVYAISGLDTKEVEKINLHSSSRWKSTAAAISRRCDACSAVCRGEYCRSYSSID